MNIVSGYGAVLWWITRCVPHSRMKRASTVLAKGPPMRCGSEPFCVSVCVCVLQGSKPGTCAGCSWCVPALSSVLPLPVGGPSSPSPRNRPGWRSGSPSGAAHHVTAWLPRCSFCAEPNTCHPAQERKRGGPKLNREMFFGFNC